MPADETREPQPGTPSDTTPAPDTPEAPDPADAPEAPAPAELLGLADGLPPVIETPEALTEYAERLAAGTGPVAVDAERASGYRYSNRAYLIQLRREGAGTGLVDPISTGPLTPLAEAMAGTEWILHAATQDLPCLRDVGLEPDALFDTELAGRLLGLPRVGLATLVETLLGFAMKKEHSAVDWSTRPLPRPWLEYAALDVEVLVELRDLLEERLREAGKLEWAHQEFEALRSFEPTPRVDAWRRTSGLHRVRGRRALAAVRALWETRDEIARTRDVTPGRIVPDSAIVAAASAMPTSRRDLLSTKGFHGRGAERYAARWVAALREAAEMDEADLPSRAGRGDGPPPPRTWAERDPVAADRLQRGREAVTAVAAQHDLPVENLLTPDYLRRLLWDPPAQRDPAALLDAVVDRLTEMGARGWQVGLTAPLLVDAVLEADAAAEVRAAERRAEQEARAAEQAAAAAGAEGQEPSSEGELAPSDGEEPSDGS